MELSLYDLQLGKCAICDNEADVQDHCHRSMIIRGWLCRSCNIREGFNANSERFEDYRNNPPALKFNIVEEYCGWNAFPHLGRNPCCIFCYHIPQDWDEEAHKKAATVFSRLLKDARSIN